MNLWIGLGRECGEQFRDAGEGFGLAEEVVLSCYLG